MSFLTRTTLGKVSSLLVLGIIITNTGYSVAADPQTTRGSAREAGTRFAPGQHRPPRGGWVRTLPHGYRRYYHAGRPFYFYDGFWYERRPGGYFIVRPPIGLHLPVPPPYYTTIWVGGAPYYYANDTYYRWADSRKSYEVVGQPSGPAESAPSLASLMKEEPAPTFVYPRNGQSAEQQSTDRYECHAWSRDQTGFDPVAMGGGVKPNEAGPRSGSYQRAVNACLEGRGYSVK